VRKNVTIIDYGMSNILSLSRALESCGAVIKVTGDAEDIREAEALVLPGVGAFRQGMEELERRGMVSVIENFCAAGKPFLGVCLGMQMMLDSSREFGEYPGLGLIPGQVRPLPESLDDGTPCIIPHTTWNRLEGKAADYPLFKDIPAGSYFYFVHSFYSDPDDKRHVMGETPFYDRMFPSVIGRENAFGLQFHPEKSGEAGLQVLRNFLTLMG